MQVRAPWLVATAALWAIPVRLAAQVDYRNLDGGRPSTVADAYPIERHAFELSLPYRFEAGGGYRDLIAPELSWGAFRNGAIGLALEWQPVRPRNSNPAPRLVSQAFVFANLAGETANRPAVALRADLGQPLDRVSGTSLTLTALATRSWRLVRAHLNGAWTVADPVLAGTPRWWVGLGLDRTLFRTSTLLIGELVAARVVGFDGTEWTAGLGLRRQIDPTWVLDLGAAWVGEDGGRFRLTAGLSHGFAIAALMGGSR
jgi:hypothetical protein